MSRMERKEALALLEGYMEEEVQARAPNTLDPAGMLNAAAQAAEGRLNRAARRALGARSDARYHPLAARKDLIRTRNAR